MANEVNQEVCARDSLTYDISQSCCCEEQNQTQLKERHFELDS